MASSKVAFILGAGAVMGLPVAAHLQAIGYKVAICSRSVTDGLTPEGYLGIPLDLAQPSRVSAAFDKVAERWGPPSVVIYNASAVVEAPNDNPFDLSTADLSETLQTNLLSAYESARCAVSLTKKARESGDKLTFIYTGNVLNRIVIPRVLARGVGKQAAAHFIAAGAAAYGNQGARFYYVDQLTPQLQPVMLARDGAAHAAFFEDLIKADEQGPWLATFVKGKGYVKV